MTKKNLPLSKKKKHFSRRNFFIYSLSLVCLLLSVLFAAPPVYPYFFNLRSAAGKIQPIKFIPRPLPVVQQPFGEKLNAVSWLAVDVDSGAVLGGENYDAAFPPASLTKVATVLTALRHYSWDQVVTVNQDYPVGRNMGLKTGEKLRVADLISGLLIHSANDAAYVLADNYPGGVHGFVAAMNTLAHKMGLKRTHFDNFDGEESDIHYSTAYDLAQLARYFLRVPGVKEIVVQEEKRVTSVDGTHSHLLQSTNELLGKVPEAKGLKTGWTDQAGECFIGFFEIPDVGKGNPHEVITIVLGSNDRFGETKKILAWIKAQVNWQDYSATHSVEIAGTKATKS